MREALYWLRLAVDAELLDPVRAASLVSEADELILTSSIKTAKQNQATPPTAAR